MDLNGEVLVSNEVTISGADQLVELQTIGYLERDYLRYDKVELSDTQQEAIVADAVGVWASQGTEEVQAGGQPPALLQEALLSSFVLFGNLDAQQKSLIRPILEETYELNLNEGFSQEDVDGRTIYTYAVNVDLTNFADATAAYLDTFGLTDLASSFRDQASGGGTIPISISVDARSRNVVAVASDGNTADEYTAHGVEAQVDEPSSELTYQQLQQRINE